MKLPETISQSSTNTALYEAASTIMTILDESNNSSSYDSDGVTESTQMSLENRDIPIVIGITISAGLILIFISILAIFKCCQHFRRKTQAKFFTVVTSIPTLDGPEQKKAKGKVEIDPASFFYPQVAELTCAKMTRSSSAPLKPTIPLLHMPKIRPRSQPGPMQGTTYSSVEERKLSNISELPKINIESHLCASASILDEDSVDLTGITVREQTEKPCRRYRPVSAEVDLDKLYAKVNYIKKRKNRMRKDSAAAIAANKSRVNTVTFYHADTDILVENEAEVVYDERTAL